MTAYSSGQIASHPATLNAPTLSLSYTQLRYLEAHFPELMQCEGEERGRLALLPQPLVARLLGSDSLNAGTVRTVACAGAGHA